MRRTPVPKQEGQNNLMADSRSNKSQRIDANDTCKPNPLVRQTQASKYGAALRQVWSRYDALYSVIGRLMQRRRLAALALGAISEQRANSPHSQLQLAKMFEVSTPFNQYPTGILTIHSRQRVTTTESKKTEAYGDLSSTPRRKARQKKLLRASRESFARTGCLRS